MFLLFRVSGKDWNYTLKNHKNRCMRDPLYVVKILLQEMGQLKDVYEALI
ncbi:unnamed protein product [Larinioides sclopetarius]|uniref:Uncharacterized protein n=1 Tax=Larinioides sclopetarius TaxID=280406 RepID=A0AAV1ZV48_9ARAC